MSNTKGLGRNEKKGGNRSSELYQLQAINRIVEAIKSSPPSSGFASESTLISVLNAIISSDQDIEILLVRDTGNGDVVVQQITNYETGTPVVTYKAVNGAAYTPVGPLEYLDPSAVLNLILTESLDQGIALDNINTKLAAATRTHNTVVTSGSGNIPTGSIRGSVLNSGSAAGIWNGVSIPAGVSIPWGEVGNRDTYAQIDYDATGTTFVIEYTI